MAGCRGDELWRDRRRARAGVVFRSRSSRACGRSSRPRRWRRPLVRRLRPRPATREATRSGGLVASGYVVARRKATVAAEITGKVVEVLVDEGKVVEAGDLLARLDDAGRKDLASPSRGRSRARPLPRDRRRPARRRAHPQANPDAVAEEFRHRGRSDQVAGASRRAAGPARARRRPSSATARLEAKRCGEVLGKHQIRAPFAGVVVERSAQPGEMISPMSAGGGFTRTGICTIVDMDSIEIEVDVNEASIGRVHAGRPRRTRCSTPIRTGPFPARSSPSSRPPIARRRPSRCASASSEGPAHPARHGDQGDVPGRARRRARPRSIPPQRTEQRIPHWRSPMIRHSDGPH